MAVDMKDRLGELLGNDTVLKLQQPNEELIAFAAELEDCFSQVDKISRATGHIEELCEKLPAVHGNIITNVGGQKDDAIDRHTELMNQVKDFYKTAINGLKRLGIEIKTAEGGPERYSAEFRIRKSQYSTLSRNLKRVMMEYNRLETNHKEEMKELVKKQLRIVGATTENLTEEKLEEMVESKDSVFTQNILIGIASRKSDLEEIDKRKKEIHKLEENVLELNEMFYDMMLLVEDQGDLVDDIENNVERATAYVSKGAVNTAAAYKYKKKNRTLMLVICVVLSVTGGVLLIVIGVIVAAIIGIQGNNGNI